MNDPVNKYGSLSGGATWPARVRFRVWIAVLLASAPVCYGQPRETFEDKGVTAHRGDSANYPENTLAAFRSAIELGVDWIELDIYRTRDGELVVIHDARTGRVADRDLMVAESSYEDLSTLDVAHRFRAMRDLSLAECPRTAMPRLAAVLTLIRAQTGTRVSIQPKDDSVDAAVALVRKLQLTDRVGFNDGDLDKMARVKELAPRIRVFWDRPGNCDLERDLEIAKIRGFESLVLHFSGVTKERVNRIHTAGLFAGAWTVNDEKTMVDLLDAGIDRIYTDAPDLLLRLRRDRRLARGVLADTGVTGGVIVHLGCDDGRLTAALRTTESYVVHGLDSQRANVAVAREHVRKLGLYGPVSIDRLSGTALPYASDLVNLVVAHDLGGIAIGEVMRVLAPNGVAYVRKDGSWSKTVKKWPADIDEWTHFLHDASNNAVAHDDRVGPPRRMQWLAKPLWLRSHETDSGISALVSASGRLFYTFDEGPIGITDERLPDRWSLIARDAFNGVQLWKRPLPRWGWRQWKREALEGQDWTKLRGQRGKFPTQLSRRLVAAGDRVFVTLGYVAPLSILNAASGELLHTVEGTESTDEILHADGRVIVCMRDIAGPQAERRGETVRDRLASIRAEDGSILWTKETRSILPLGLAIEGDRLLTLGRGTLASTDLDTGAEVWLIRIPGRAKGTLVAHDGVALLSGGGAIQAFSIANGARLWATKVKTSKGAAGQDLFVAGGLGDVGPGSTTRCRRRRAGS